MRTQPHTDAANPQIHQSKLGATTDEIVKAKAVATEHTSRQAISDWGTQATAIFGEATTQQEQDRRLAAELIQEGSQHISAASLMSHNAETVEISLPAERVAGGWKAIVASRQSGQPTENLAAVRSDLTGKWTMMLDEMKAAGQNRSQPESNVIYTKRFAKSVANPIQGPYTAKQGDEIATKMLGNIAHLEGKDFISADDSERRGGEVDSAQSILKAIKTTKGMSGDVYVYNVSGEPAAVMKGEMREHYSPARFHVGYIVSDPYVRGGGTALLEKAVNISLQHGGGGTVTLDAASGGAVDQYKKLGFIYNPMVESSIWTTPMILEPGESEMWRVNDQDQYTFVGNQGQKYVTELGRP